MHAPTGLLCDLLARPKITTIATPVPTFGWVLNSSAIDDTQTACQVLVASTAEQITEGQGDYWDTGRLAHTKSLHLPYAGRSLQAGASYFWRVRVWGKSDEPSPWSEPQSFTLADAPDLHATSRYPVLPQRFPAKEITVIGPEHSFIDFGKHAFGWLELTLESAEDNTIVEVRLGERIVNHRIDLEPGDSTIRSARVMLQLGAGRHLYRVEIPFDKRNTTDPLAIQLPEEFGAVMPFRYVEIINHPVAPDTADVVQVRLEYPFDERASAFSSSDPDLDAVWEFCKYSIQATTYCGIYVDGDRERIPYEADAFINQLGHYAVDREFSLARHSHEFLVKRPTWPTEWIQFSVLTAWADFEATGDTRSLDRYYEELKTQKIYLDRARPDGLIDTHDLKDIVDWPDGERDNYDFRPVNTVVNAFHYRTLVLMHRIATALDHDADTERFAHAATRVKESFHQIFFNPETGRYRDGEDSNHEAFHASLFALAFDLVPTAHKEGIVTFLKSRGMACSVYAAQFLLDGFFSEGEADYAISLMTSHKERSWHNMLNQGATITWEAWDNRFKPNQDWNHAWGAAPANIIPRHILGVQPLEPGYGRVRIAPQPGPLTELHGTVPTIRGPIQVDLTKNTKGNWQLDTQVPTGVTAEIIIPAD